MHEEVICAAKHQHRTADPHSPAVQFAFHQFLVLTHFDADVAKHAAPDRRAKDREKRKQFIVHPHDSRGNSDQMPHYRQEPGDKDAHRAMVLGPPFRTGYFGFRNQGISPIAHYQRPPRPTRSPIHRRRAEPRTDRAGNDNSDNTQWHVIRVRPMRCGWDDKFTWHRHNRAFDRHEPRNQRVPKFLQRAEIPRLEPGDNFGHEPLLIAENWEVSSIRCREEPSSSLLTSSPTV